MKTNQFISLSAIFAIALTFFACSSDSGDPPSGGVPSSNSGGANQMVSCKLTAGNCSQMSLSTCMELVNAGEAQIVPNCTTNPPSSSSIPRPSSSSITPPSSSSALAPNALEITLTKYEELGSLDPTGYGDPRISFQVLAYRQGTRLNNVTTGLLLNQDDIRIWTGSSKATVTISDLSDSVVVYPIVLDADVMSDDDVSPNGCSVKNFINGTTYNDIERKNSKVSVTFSLRFIRR
jgi:hypothetical protein